VSSDFVHTGSSHMHCCRAFHFALAGLFLFCYSGTLHKLEDHSRNPTRWYMSPVA